MILNERVDVDVLAPGLGQPPVENLGRLMSGFSPLVGLERPLNDFGNGSSLTPRELMREVARPGAADGKLSVSGVLDSALFGGGTQARQWRPAVDGCLLH